MKGAVGLGGCLQELEQLFCSEQRKSRRSCASLHDLLVTSALRVSEEKLQMCKVAATDLTVHGKYKKDE